MDDEVNEDPSDEELVISEKIRRLDESARKMGLYLDRAGVTDIPTPLGIKRGIVAEFTIGDVAFSQRVQNPEQTQIDKQFKEMTHGLGTDDFLERRAQMKKNIEEGRHPMDDGK